jgi:hypothetical protein
MNGCPEYLYLKHVAAHLTCPRKERNRLLQQAKQEINAYCTQLPHVDLRELKLKFGQPIDFADALMTHFTYLRRLQFVRRKIRQLLTAALALLCVCGILLFQINRISNADSGCLAVSYIQSSE